MTETNVKTVLHLRASSTLEQELKDEKEKINASKEKDMDLEELLRRRSIADNKESGQ